MKQLLFLLVIFFAVFSAACTDNASLLIGNWQCESGPCFDEEISFSIENGENTFNSWLHERPSAMEGSWQLNGDNLTVDCCAGVGFDWTIVKISKKELIVHEAGYDDHIVFKRIGE